MATPLSFYPRPPICTGLGMHDSHLTGDNPPDVRQHARNLRRAGFSYYKLLVGGVNKVERARIYAEEGIMCIVRLYAERPHPRFQPNRDEVAQYVAVGAKYFEAGNEPNLLDETEGGINPEADATQWIRASDTIKSAGGVPVVYACTPGGHMSHRTYTTRFLAEVRRLGRLDSFDRAVLGIHPRPLNNPPDAAVGTGNPPNTTTWNEWTWYRDTYRAALGWTIPMIATEHGYSGGGQENGEHPPMNALTWAEWNKELFNRFNPSHPKALPPEFLAATYWLEVNHGVWIHDGPFANNGREWIGDAPRQDDRAWGKALWTIQPNWNRAGATVPPPPPPDPEIPLPPPTGTINLPAWVTVNRVTVAPGQQYYKLQSAHWQDSNTSGGLHHIFIEQPHDATKSFNVSNGQESWNIPLDKPLNEPAGNFAMFSGNVYAAKMNGLPSDTVIGMTMPQNQHVSFFLEWEERTKGEVPMPVPAPSPVLETLVLTEGASAAVVPITPGFALFDRVIADGLIPNGPERYIAHDGKTYVLRSAEHAFNGGAYVYFAERDRWDTIQRLTRRPPRDTIVPAPQVVINHSRKSPNYDERPDDYRPMVLQLHHTGGGLVSSLNHLCDPASKVSSHYVVGREGKIYQLVDESKRAWHSGPGIHKGREDPNDFTVSIEIVNKGDGVEPYPPVQLDAVVALSRDIIRRHTIRRDDVTTHKATRAAYKAKYPNTPNVSLKGDPSANFPLEETVSRIFA